MFIRPRGNHHVTFGRSIAKAAFKVTYILFLLFPIDFWNKSYNHYELRLL